MAGRRKRNVMRSPKYNFMLEQTQKQFLRHLYKRCHGYYPFMYSTPFLQEHLGFDSLQVLRAITLLIAIARLDVCRKTVFEQMMFIKSSNDVPASLIL